MSNKAKGQYIGGGNMSEAEQKELDRQISEATFADVWGLFEHGRWLTKRELDRVIRSLGYLPVGLVFNCGLCGGQMSFNPHLNAGKPPHYLEVGTKYVCIPCTAKGLHQWAKRAMVAETKLSKFEPVQLEVLGDEEILNAVERIEIEDNNPIDKIPSHRWMKANKAISQATITHNETKGQLYRRRE